jgi:hypothetical protein
MTPSCQELLSATIRRIDELERKLFDLADAYNYQRRMACKLFDQLNPDNSRELNPNPQPTMTFRPPELKTPEPMEIHLRSLVKESASSLADMEMNLHEARLTIASLRNELNSERFAAQRLMKERDSTQAALNNALAENDRLKREVEDTWKPILSWSNIQYPCQIKREGEDAPMTLETVPHPAFNIAGITHWRPL